MADYAVMLNGKIVKDNISSIERARVVATKVYPNNNGVVLIMKGTKKRYTVKGQIERVGIALEYWDNDKSKWYYYDLLTGKLKRW